MIKAKVKYQPYSWSGTFRTVFLSQKNDLGECFVKHLEPINLGDYLQDKFGTPLIHQDNFEQAALTLSQDLMRIQSENTPTTLNALISALLLQEKE